MDKKTLSIVSYITIIGWVIAFIIYNGKPDKSSLEKFHLEQSLGLGILGMACGIISNFMPSSIVMIFSLASIAIFVLWIIGIINASKEEEKPVPLVGSMFIGKFDFIK